MRMMEVLVVGVMLAEAQSGWAQEVCADRQERVRLLRWGGCAEVPVEGMVRRDQDAVAWTLAGGAKATELLLHDFEFEGARVATSKLHFTQLAPGVVEVTSVAYTVGEWQFQVRDTANYYGLGERYDTLNHSHTIVLNRRRITGLRRARGRTSRCRFL